MQNKPIPSAGPVHVDELTRCIGFDRNSGVDSLRLSGEIRVECANDNPSVIRGSALMEAEKVAAIVSQEDPAFRSRERQNLDIWYARVRISGVHRG